MGRPRTRVLVGAGALALTAAAVRSDGVGPVEAHTFAAVNSLPDGVAGPTWTVMQTGNLLAAPVAAALAGASGHRRTARLLLVSGTTAWALAKVVKGVVRRPRPTTLLPTVRRRGRVQKGSGFVSGHAAVAASLCAAALPELPAPYRRAALAMVLSVGAARLYVGAHLPLDVVGGIALGVAVEGAVELAIGGAPG